MHTQEDFDDLRVAVSDAYLMLKRHGADPHSGLMRRLDFVWQYTSGELPENYHIAQDTYGRFQVYHGVLPTLHTPEYFYSEYKARHYCWFQALFVDTAETP
jgi:hypothetical protein